MKRILLAALAVTATAAFAQQPAAPAAPATPVALPDVPGPKCDPKPKWPGPRMREDAKAMKDFKRDHDAFVKCMQGYLDERKAAIKANENAANAAIEDYNNTMKALQEAQKSQ